MVWGVNKHKHSISNVFIFHVISLFSCFLEIINFSMVFFLGGGLIFGPGIFLGFVGSPRNFFPFWVLALLHHPRHLKSRVRSLPPPPPPPPPGTLVFFSVFTTECQYFCLRSLGVVRQRGRKEGRKRTNDNVFLPIEITIAFIWLSDL